MPGYSLKKGRGSATYYVPTERLLDSGLSSNPLSLSSNPLSLSSNPNGLLSDLPEPEFDELAAANF